MSAVWQVQPLTPSQRQSLEPLLRENWGGPLIASRGRLLDARQLPGLWVGEEDRLVGYLLYHPEGDQWEVALLEALEQGRGVGSALLGAVEALARRCGCKRLWLVTTNDNTHALAFYQRRGFVLAALHRAPGGRGGHPPSGRAGVGEAPLQGGKPGPVSPGNGRALERKEGGKPWQTPGLFCALRGKNMKKP